MEFRQAMHLFWKFEFPTITVLFLLWLSSTAVANACPLHERNCLLHFKSAVLDEMDTLQSWQGFNCCRWDGVGCDFRTGHVTQLDLSDYYLEGNISSSLLELAQLEHLDLSHNSLQGNLSNIGKLKRLTFLDLSFNYVSLVNLSNLTSLEYLSLDGADISSMKAEEWGKAVGRLSGLRELSMSHCGLRGPIPYSLVNLTSLLHLDLSVNSLSAQIPTWFANLTSHLLSLDLSVNDLFGPVPSNLWHSAYQLQQLGFSRTSLLSEIPSAIGNMSSLESLDLSFANIEGLIPPSIGNLSKLVYLDLSVNKLSGAIPRSIDSLSSLVYLDLSVNKLSGVIPPSIGSLSSLVFLGLNSNQLNGTIPSSFSKLVRLKILWLDSNSLNDSVSLSLFHGLTKLQNLCLSNNHLTVSINSTWIPQFENLMSLGLGLCNLAGIPPFLVTQYYLKALDLSANSITGNIPTWIWNLPNLCYLILASNRFTCSLPSKLIASALQIVDLHNNSLEGVVPLLPNVQYLDLSMNELNGFIPSDIAVYNRDTTFLSLSKNNLSGAIPESLCIPTIKILDLSKNMLSNKIPPNFGRNCSNLKVLNFADNHLEGEISKEWENLIRLHTLNLNGNQLRGVIPSSIAKCYCLQVLDLGNNNLEGTVPHWIGNLSQLHILMLRSNKFQGNIPPEIIGLPRLQILDLSHNKLSGSIPNNLTNLLAMKNSSQSSSDYLHEEGTYNPYKNQKKLSMKDQDLEYVIVLSILKCIDLSRNNLSSGIPSKMGSLQGLKALNLSRNHLSGQIPKTLGGMSQLESLDLSVNILNGAIPLELEALNYLQVLNLSYNRLGGKVPIGRQFLTFGEASYLGNANLSGIPFSNTTCKNSWHEQQKCTSGDTSVDEGVDSEDGEMTWWTWAMVVGLSYAVGFSIVIGALTFNNRVRETIFNLYDGIILGMLERG